MPHPRLPAPRMPHLRQLAHLTRRLRLLAWTLRRMRRPKLPEFRLMPRLRPTLLVLLRPTVWRWLARSRPPARHCCQVRLEMRLALRRRRKRPA